MAKDYKEVKTAQDLIDSLVASYVEVKGEFSHLKESKHDDGSLKGHRAFITTLNEKTGNPVRMSLWIPAESEYLTTSLIPGRETIFEIDPPPPGSTFFELMGVREIETSAPATTKRRKPKSA